MFAIRIKTARHIKTIQYTAFQQHFPPEESFKRSKSVKYGTKSILDSVILVVLITVKKDIQGKPDRGIKT